MGRGRRIVKVLGQSTQTSYDVAKAGLSRKWGGDSEISKLE